ncbi:hypothetical protein BGZ76_003536 [Entomortierella beljakovae]|nr:hypothetical protein BGZ76_003536 [Entomortierella beljakovae]
MSQTSPSQPLLSTDRSSYGATLVPDKCEKLSPEASASLFSVLTISWMSPLFKIGYGRQLQEDDIYEMLPDRRANVIGPQLQEHWDNEKRQAAVAGREPSLARAIGWFILPHYWLGQISLFVSDIIAKVVPFIVLWVIVFLEDSQDETKQPPPAWHGYALGVLLFVVSVMLTGSSHYWVIRSNRTGNLTRVGLIDMIFRKSSVISSKSRLEYPDGKVFNLMSTDASRIDSTLEGVTLLAVVPFSCVVTVIMLIYLMGPSAILGTFILIFANPFQAWAMAMLHSIRIKAASLTDKRIHVVTEILQGIKVIKFFTFEPSFAKKVSEIRTSELKCISLLMQVRGIIYSVSSSLPVFASALSFVLYAALGNELSPKVIFPALTLFTGLRVPLLVLPYIYSEASDAWVSIKRIEQFLLTPDTEPLPPIDTTHKYAISLKNASFYWDQVPSSASIHDGTNNHNSQEQRPLLSDQDQDQDQDQEYTPESFLKDINLDIPRGSLVALVGPVGCGKSSLIQAMIGNMMKSQGEVIRGSTIGYASQTHWIQNATVRNNILFDTPWEEERYWRVVRACSLEKDLSSMPYGDQTEIGERGVNLSGGQKARLSLARCVYYDAETVIMDDPLSAVDAHVGKSLWEDCVLKELSKKTRIIATHQLHVLKDVDYVVCLNHGRISEQGTFQDLMADTKGHFHSLMKQYGGAHHEQDEEGEPVHKHRIVLKRNKSSGKVQLADSAAESDDEATILSEESDKEEEVRPIVPQSQMAEEERAFGAISSLVYLNYIELGGYWRWATILILALLQQFIGVWMSVWLSYWTNDEFHLPLWTYINVYVGTGILQLIVVISGSLFLVVVIMRSSALMHDLSFIKVLYSPMSFFDTTPMGRILNRQDMAFIKTHCRQLGVHEPD